MNKFFLLILSFLIFSHTTIAMKSDESSEWKDEKNNSAGKAYSILDSVVTTKYRKNSPKNILFYVRDTDDFTSSNIRNRTSDHPYKNEIENEQDYAETQHLAETYFTLGMQEYEQKTKESYKKALKYFHIAAEMKHDISENSVGAMYEYGLGTDKDIELAKKWYEKAAKNGNTSAKQSLHRISEKENSYKNTFYRTIFG